MKAGLWLLFLCLIALPVRAQEDWRATLSPPEPGKFPPPRPLRAVYRFGWSGVTAAQAKFDFAKVPHGQFRLTMTTQTIGLARTMWRMDSQHTAYCQVATLRPLSLQQTETYKNETKATQATFTPEYVMRITRETPQKGPEPKEKKLKLPNVFDLQTGLFFVRSQRMQEGDHYRFVVYPATSPYYADIEVLGREKVKVATGTHDAIKCQVRLQGISKEFELEPHKKFKNAYAWLSDDKDRLLLRIEAEIFVGSVWCELQSVEFDPKP